MLTDTLDFTGIDDSVRENRKLALKNKIRVTCTHSQDGRTRDSLYIDYNREKGAYALFLLEGILNQSDAVYQYSVFDEFGNRESFVDSECFSRPKRV